MIKYCQNCSADLALAKANRCYKCGRGFDLGNPRTYNTSRHASLYRPWYRFTRYPIHWSGATIVTCLATVLAGNGIALMLAYVYSDLFNSLTLRIPNMALLGLWGILIIPIALLRKPGNLRSALITTAPVLFAAAAVVAVVFNQVLAASTDNKPPVDYIIQGIAWPAICLWTIALATGWHPILRTIPCVLVCMALLAYWYLRVFVATPVSTHPVTFITSVPFFLSMLIPIGTWVWSQFPERKPKAKSKPKEEAKKSAAASEPASAKAAPPPNP